MSLNLFGETKRPYLTQRSNSCEFFRAGVRGVSFASSQFDDQRIHSALYDRRGQYLCT